MAGSAGPSPTWGLLTGQHPQTASPPPPPRSQSSQGSVVGRLGVPRGKDEWRLGECAGVSASLEDAALDFICARSWVHRPCGHRGTDLEAHRAQKLSPHSLARRTSHAALRTWRWKSREGAAAAAAAQLCTGDQGCKAPEHPSRGDDGAGPSHGHGRGFRGAEGTRLKGTARARSSCCSR